MRGTKMMFLLFAGLFLGAQLSTANTVQVGGCLKGVTNFTTISAAVAAVPADSTIKVCPGTYAEQVVISTPLTLEGISSGNLGRAIVAFPGGGLTTVTTVTDQGVVAPQVLVEAGPVNITNITVDGTGNNLNGTGNKLAGIFYASGASGTVNGVLARAQNGCGCGVGIWAENGSGPSESVTIENSLVRDADFLGMFLASGVSPPTLTATVKGNQIINTPTGILSGFLDGIISSNSIIDHASVGILSDGSSTTIISNVISAVQGKSVVIGIQIIGNGIVKSNTIMDENGSSTGSGIDVSLTTGATVEGNKIIDSVVGIEFGCKTGNTVSGNTINGMNVGLGSVPTGLSVPGTVQNVDTLRTGGC